MVKSQTVASAEGVQDWASKGETEPSASTRVSASKMLRNTLKLIGDVSSIGSSVRTSDPCDTTTVSFSAAIDPPAGNSNRLDASSNSRFEGRYGMVNSCLRLVWRFGSPHRCCSESETRPSELKPHQGFLSVIRLCRS